MLPRMALVIMKLKTTVQATSAAKFMRKGREAPGEEEGEEEAAISVVVAAAAAAAAAAAIVCGAAAGGGDRGGDETTTPTAVVEFSRRAARTGTDASVPILFKIRQASCFAAMLDLLLTRTA